MNRRPIQVLASAACAVCAVAAVAWGSGAAAAATTGPAASSSLPASLGDQVCHHALPPAKRSVAATAVVHPISDSTKLAVDFRLLRRTAGTAFTAVHGTGLNTWLTKSMTGTSSTWRLIHTVSDLSAPADYRFAVKFRWIGSGGQTLARTTRSGRICHQPELRPDLEVLAIDVLADSTNAQEDVYRAQIHDAGATGAGPFQVQLADQGTVHTRRVLHIRAHRSLWVRLVGPVCNSSQPPVVTVDPHDRIDVYSRSQASLTATCPAPSSGTSGASAA